MHSSIVRYCCYQRETNGFVPNFEIRNGNHEEKRLLIATTINRTHRLHKLRIDISK